MLITRWLDKIWLAGLIILFLLAPIIMIRGPEGGIHNLVLKETVSQGFLLLFVFTIIAKKLIEKKRAFTRSPLDFLFLALLLLSAISIFYSPTFYTSAQEFTKLALFIIFYFLVIDQIQDEKTMYILFIPIIASAAITAFFATCQNQQIYLWGFLPQAEDRNRLMATMGHNNGVASYLMMSGFILLGWLLQKKRSKSINFWAGLLLIWFLFIIVATLSRGVWMGTCVGLVIFGYLLIRRVGMKNFVYQYQKPIIVGLVILIGFTGILSFKNPLNPWNVSVTKRFSETWLTWHTYVGDTRIRMWATTWETIQDHPFRGIGLGAFKYLVPLYQGKFFENHPNTRLEPTSALTNQSHNEYLQSWAELGILGIILGLSALIIYLRSGWKTITYLRELEKRHQDAPVASSILFTGLYAGSIGILIQSLVDFPLHIAPLALVFLFMAALVMNAHRIIAVKPIAAITEERLQPYHFRNLSIIIVALIIYIITLIPLSIILISNRYQQQCGYYLAQASRYEGEPYRTEQRTWLLRAITAGDESVILQPTSGRAQYYLGLAYLRFGDLSQGIEHLQLAQKDLEYRDLHYELGRAYQRLELYPAAITEYKKAIYIYPPSFDAYDRLDEIYEHTGQMANRFAVWKKIIKYNPQYLDETVVNKGYEYRIDKQWDLAESVFQFGLSVDSTNLKLWRALTGLYYASKQYDKLSSASQQLIELSPNEAVTYQRLAVGYLAQGKFTKAIDAADKALQLDPKLALAKRVIKEATKKNPAKL
ncbi:MAG: O-antigen ligase family protein [bacterium]